MEQLKKPSRGLKSKGPMGMKQVQYIRLND